MLRRIAALYDGINKVTLKVGHLRKHVGGVIKYTWMTHVECGSYPKFND